MKNKKAKRLMLNTCIRVNEIGEVSWINSISITGRNLLEGSTLIHSEYLGAFEDSAQSIAEKADLINLPNKEKVEVRL